MFFHSIYVMSSYLYQGTCKYLIQYFSGSSGPEWKQGLWNICHALYEGDM